FLASLRCYSHYEARSRKLALMSALERPAQQGLAARKGFLRRSSPLCIKSSRQGRQLCAVINAAMPGCRNLPHARQCTTSLLAPLNAPEEQPAALALLARINY